MIETLDLVGGRPELDLANTVNVRPTPTRDDLASYEGLLEWAIAAGVVDEGRAETLRALEPVAAQRELRDARQLRETVYRIFSAVAAGRPVDPLAAEELLASHAGALPFATLRPTPDGQFELAWSGRAAIVGPLVQSAIDLLRSGQLHQVKECPSCGWLFLDRSRNGSRRWCSMETCGSRDKMRRYHHRRSTVDRAG
jgi:predicted RNA-binding Zn ribbon-like protein